MLKVTRQWTVNGADQHILCLGNLIAKGKPLVLLIIFHDIPRVLLNSKVYYEKAKHVIAMKSEAGFSQTQHMRIT